MTTSGLIMMLTTWFVVLSFTLYFFFKVMRKPLEKDETRS